MSETEQGPTEGVFPRTTASANIVPTVVEAGTVPTVGKSDSDLLIEIRDLLAAILAALKPR